MARPTEETGEVSIGVSYNEVMLKRIVAASWLLDFDFVAVTLILSFCFNWSIQKVIVTCYWLSGVGKVVAKDPACLLSLSSVIVAPFLCSPMGTQFTRACSMSGV